MGLTVLYYGVGCDMIYFKILLTILYSFVLIGFWGEGGPSRTFIYEHTGITESEMKNVVYVVLPLLLVVLFTIFCIFGGISGVAGRIMDGKPIITHDDVEPILGVLFFGIPFIGICIPWCIVCLVVCGPYILIWYEYSTKASKIIKTVAITVLIITTGWVVYKKYEYNKYLNAKNIEELYQKDFKHSESECLDYYFTNIARECKEFTNKNHKRIIESILQETDLNSKEKDALTFDIIRKFRIIYWSYIHESNYIKRILSETGYGEEMYRYMMDELHAPSIATIHAIDKELFYYIDNRKKYNEDDSSDMLEKTIISFYNNIPKEYKDCEKQLAELKQQILDSRNYKFVLVQGGHHGFIYKSNYEKYVYETYFGRFEIASTIKNTYKGIFYEANIYQYKHIPSVKFLKLKEEYYKIYYDRIKDCGFIKLD